MTPSEKNSKKSLQNNHYKTSYDSFEDSPVEYFYIPSLNESILYNRAVGYFSSAIIAVLSEAFTNFAERGGKMNLICSPILTASDASTLENISRVELLNDLNDALDLLDSDGLIQEPLNLMALLIKNGCLTIKFAIPYDSTAGIFHQKVGIFYDHLDNKVAFKGSNNESLSGWIEMKNSENFSVYTSWRDDNDSSRVEDEERRFERMWTDQYKGFDIVDFQRKLNFIERRSTEDLDIKDIKKAARKWYETKNAEKRGKRDDWLRSYQREVVDNWIDNDYQGVVSFATGAGKTITAIGAIKYWLDELDRRTVIILVPSVRLQKQWLAELRKFEWFKDHEFLLVGGIGKPDQWMKALKDITSSRRHDNDGIVLAVIDTARTPAFYERVQWGGHLLVVADEMHRLGAQSFLPLLDSVTAGGLLGLSATPERYNEDENIYLESLFGEELKPIIDISAAQEMGILVPYYYNFETLMLTDDEIDNYNLLTRKIGAASSDNSNEENMRILLSQRANILKSASAKVPVAERVLRREYKSGDYWIVFCNDKEQLSELRESILDLHPLVIYADMDGSDDQTISLYQHKGGILLTIHMFDEGVDIPAIDHCLIIASSQSKREFIQRRGRVLRTNKQRVKGYADIWDLIIVDENGNAFKDSEIDRALEFSKTAFNKNIQRELEKLGNKRNIP